MATNAHYAWGLPKHRNPQNIDCDNDPKPLSRCLFLTACAQSCRESRLARNVTALHLQLHAAF